MDETREKEQAQSMIFAPAVARISQATITRDVDFELRGWEYTGDSVLGLSWNKNFDTLSVNVPILSELNV